MPGFGENQEDKQVIDNNIENVEENEQQASLENEGADFAGQENENEKPSENEGPADEAKENKVEVEAQIEEDIEVDSGFNLDAGQIMESELKGESEPLEVEDFNTEGKDGETLAAAAKGICEDINEESEIIDDVKNSAEYSRKKSILEDKIQEHEKNRKKLEEWAKGKDEDEVSKGIFTYYKEQIKLDDISKAFDTQAEIEAKKRLATKDALLDFEDGRLKEARSGDSEVIKKLFDYAYDNGIKNFEEVRPDFTTYCYTIAKPLVEGRKVEDVSDENIIKRERERIDRETFEGNERIKLYEKKLEELGIADDKLDTPNKDFARFYKDNGGSLFFKEAIINGLVDATKIIDIELSELKRDNATKKAYDIYQILLKQKKEYETLEEPYKKSSLETARKLFFGTEGFKLSDVVAEAYRMATSEEIIYYEERKVNRIEDDLFLGKRVDELLASIDYTGISQKVFSPDNKKRKEIIKNNVEIDTLIKYEDEQIAYFERVRDAKEEQRHRSRRGYLSGLYNEIKKIEDGEIKDAEINALRADYFKGAFDYKGEDMGDLKIAPIKDFLDAAVEGRYIADDQQILEALKKEIIDSHYSKEFIFSDNHVLLLKKLKDLKANGASEDEIMDFYRKERGMNISHFSKDIMWDGLDLKAFISFDEMINFTRSKLRDLSKLSWATRKKKGIGDKEIANHFDRIEALAKLRDSQEYLDLPEDERRKRLKELYIDELKAGGALNKFVSDTDNTQATPKMIMDYERRLVHEENEKKLKEFELLVSGRKREYKAAAEGEDNVFVIWAKDVFRKTHGEKELLKIEPKEIIDNLTPLDILEYQYEYFKDAGPEYSKRVAFLKDSNITQENAYEEYDKKFGTGDFFKAKAEQLQKLKVSLSKAYMKKGTFGLDKLVKFEQDRENLYKKELEALPDKEIARSKERLQKLNNNYEKIRAAIRKLGELGSSEEQK